MESKFGITKNPYNKRYFKSAMEYFREDHEDSQVRATHLNLNVKGQISCSYFQVIFLFVSDDMDWGRQNLKNKLGDLFFVGKKSQVIIPEFLVMNYDFQELETQMIQIQ